MSRATLKCEVMTSIVPHRTASDNTRNNDSTLTQSLINFHESLSTINKNFEDTFKFVTYNTLLEADSAKKSTQRMLISIFSYYEYPFN